MKPLLTSPSAIGGKQRQDLHNNVTEKTLVTIINFIYTGELEVGEDSNILGKMITDLLIASDQHGAEDLSNITLERIRDNKEIISHKGFREIMKQADCHDLNN